MIIMIIVNMIIIFISIKLYSYSPILIHKQKQNLDFWIVKFKFFFIGIISLLLKKTRFGFFSVSKVRVLCNRSRRELSNGVKIASNGANLASFWCRQSLYLCVYMLYICIITTITKLQSYRPTIVPLKKPKVELLTCLK